PVGNVTVTWAPASGGGSVSPTSSLTDVNGHATSTRTLGPTPGTQTTTAGVTGLPTVTFTITASVAGASQMSLKGGDRQTDPAGAQRFERHDRQHRHRDGARPVRQPGPRQDRHARGDRHCERHRPAA